MVVGQKKKKRRELKHFRLKTLERDAEWQWSSGKRHLVDAVMMMIRGKKYKREKET